MLVRVDERGRAAAERIPTASVRLLQPEIEIDGQTTWDEFIELMQLEIHRRQPEEGERVWLIDWRVRYVRSPLAETSYHAAGNAADFESGGTGRAAGGQTLDSTPLLDVFERDDLTGELVELFEQDLALPQRLFRRHRFLLIPAKADKPSRQPAESDGSPDPDAVGADDAPRETDGFESDSSAIGREFFFRLDAAHPFSRQTLRGCLGSACAESRPAATSRDASVSQDTEEVTEGSRTRRTPLFERLDELIDTQDMEAVAARADRLAAKWFGRFTSIQDGCCGTAAGAPDGSAGNDERKESSDEDQ